jgi:SAM-dependent methyltransferase
MLLDRGLLTGIAVGDPVKSWDVLKTVALIEEKLAKDAPVLDIGAYASEVPLILHRVGYRRITALDLNPGIARMPFAPAVDYRVGNFLQAPFPDEQFQAVTATSVIEHGFRAEPLAAEMARLLRPGGLFIASFDYWPQKIDTTGVDLFGMSWTIFSRGEIEDFLAVASRHALLPLGALEFESSEAPIRFMGRHYTFAWLALVKR